MEDKLFELMTKMYSEFSEFRKDMNEFRQETKDDIRVLKNDVIRIENKLDAAFDGYKQTLMQVVKGTGMLTSPLLDVNAKMLR